MDSQLGRWTRGEIIAVAALLVALTSALAAVFVVPEFRRWAGLDPGLVRPTSTQQASPRSEQQTNARIINPEDDRVKPTSTGSSQQSTPEVKTQLDQPRKDYRITPTEPSNGNRGDYTVLLKECHRSDDLIKCWGLMTNTTDAPRLAVLGDSTAVDDEGNSISIWTMSGGFMFPGANSMYGGQQRLMPDVPTKFIVTASDPHRNVKTINFDLRVSGGSPYRYDELILKDVPVQ